MPRDSRVKRPKFAEFFAGIGLVRHGLERTGWKVEFANDISKKKKVMYEGHFGPAPYYSIEDIHDQAENPDQVPVVALAHASFPCTDLSIAGKRKGLRAGQSSAFWGFHQLLRNQGKRRPPLVLLENVTGFLSSRGGEDFAAAMRAMNELGYDVDPLIVDAIRFVPQSRERLFVVCVRHDLGRHQRADGADIRQSECRPARLCQALEAFPDISCRIRSLPELPERCIDLADIVQDPPADSKDWWPQERREYLYSQMSDRHRMEADKMIAAKVWSYATVFRRKRKDVTMAELRADGVAGCLRASTAGSSKQILFKAGFDQYHVRLVNPRECAALMGAPYFHIRASTTQAISAFGDGVCADVMDWIATNYLNPLWQEIRGELNPRARSRPT